MFCAAVSSSGRRSEALSPCRFSDGLPDIGVTRGPLPMEHYERDGERPLGRHQVAVTLDRFGGTSKSEQIIR
jgi:hypothetical protein